MVRVQLTTTYIESPTGLLGCSITLSLFIYSAVRTLKIKGIDIIPLKVITSDAFKAPAKGVKTKSAST